jgi:hypothetical protein
MLQEPAAAPTKEKKSFWQLLTGRRKEKKEK